LLTLRRLVAGLTPPAVGKQDGASSYKPSLRLQQPQPQQWLASCRGNHGSSLSS